jgi:type VI protein secretion system component VasF
MWEYTRLRDQLKEMLRAFLDDADDSLSQHVKGAIQGLLDGAHTAIADTSPVADQG